MAGGKHWERHVGPSRDSGSIFLALWLPHRGLQEKGRTVSVLFLKTDMSISLRLRYRVRLHSDNSVKVVAKKNMRSLASHRPRARDIHKPWKSTTIKKMVFRCHEEELPSLK